MAYTHSLLAQAHAWGVICCAPTPPPSCASLRVTLSSITQQVNGRSFKSFKLLGRAVKCDTSGSRSEVVAQVESGSFKVRGVGGSV